MKLNVGSGDFPFPAPWVNVDSGEGSTTLCDVYADARCLPFSDGSVEEIYCGHVLEHMPLTDGIGALQEMRRVLVPGGRIGIVVPDFRESVKRWLKGEFDLDYLNDIIIYSYVQDSPHRWCYDALTLERAMATAGFRKITPIKTGDPRIVHDKWWNLGRNGVK